MSFCINPACHFPSNPSNDLFCQKCGSELLLSGRYRVKKLLSNQGGFSHTYEVLYQDVKVLKVLKDPTVKPVELFEREYQVLRQLNISGIPKAEDYFIFQPRNSPLRLPCMVMEKIEGLDLESYLNQKGSPIDEKCALNWLIQIVKILDQLHAQGLIHRDIKPSNIILKPDGNLVLIDFGAVGKMTASPSGKPTIIYTHDYAAPEQIQGKAVYQSDFFSLGRTFVTLLTGKNLTDLFNKTSISPEWHNYVSGVAPTLIGLLDQMMEPLVERRPANAQTILEYLTNIEKMFSLPPSQSLYPSPSTSSQSGSSVLPPPQPKNPPKRKSWQKFVMFSMIGLLSVLVLGFTVPQINFLFDSGIGNPKNFTQVRNVPKGNFTFGGSTTWATTRQSGSAIDTAIQGVYPEFQLSYIDPTTKDNQGNFLVKSVRDGKCPSKTGSNTGICMLLAGDLTFAQSSTSLEKSAYASEAENKLKEIPVAYDALTVVVNPSLTISGLTVAQLRDIYTGKITSWKEVGGPDLPILAFSRPLNAGGTVSSFRDLVLKDKSQDKQYEFNWNVVKEAISPGQGLQSVAKEPGGIFFGSAKEMIVDFCEAKPLPIGKQEDDFIPPYQEPLRFGQECQQQRNQINQESIKSGDYPLTRQIFVIVKQEKSLDQQAGEAYARLLLTQQGQKLLEKAGFVSLSDD